jgi:aryl-alcohol dehydrogenase-like predicted oxidoreductase
VRAGKVLYVAMSDIPAGQAARMQTLADLRRWAPLVALQIEYNLVERPVERNLIPMAREMGLGVVPWSPLASGVLTGKYSRTHLDGDEVTTTVGASRKNLALNNGSLHERGLAIAEVVKEVADEIGHSPAQAALAWTLLNPAVTSTIVGARTLDQLEVNLGALDVEFTDDHRARLDEVSAIDPGFPHVFLRSPLVCTVVHGDTKIAARV